jgi:hypothetical protein
MIRSGFPEKEEFLPRESPIISAKNNMRTVFSNLCDKFLLSERDGRSRALLRTIDLPLRAEEVQGVAFSFVISTM